MRLFYLKSLILKSHKISFPCAKHPLNSISLSKKFRFFCLCNSLLKISFGLSFNFKNFPKNLNYKQPSSWITFIGEKKTWFIESIHIHSTLMPLPLLALFNIIIHGVITYDKEIKPHPMHHYHKVYVYYFKWIEKSWILPNFIIRLLNLAIE